jgi:uncharacterized tellurite resistance protein B-like protein
MLDQIRLFFHGKMHTAAEHSSGSRQGRIALATAALLLEMAHADSEFGSVDEQNILDLLREYFNLSEGDSAQLMVLAEAERQEALDIWQFTNLINQHYDKDEKRDLLEILWRIIYADGKVGMHKDYLIRKMNNLLNLDHNDMIETKFRVQQSLNENKSEE